MLSTNKLLKENVILKEKVAILTNLCQQHCSQYDQLNIKWEHKYYENQDKYINIIRSLQQQIDNQRLKCENMNNKVQSCEQQSIVVKNEYESTILTDHHTIKQQKEDLKAMESTISTTDEQITALKEEIKTLNEEIIYLKYRLDEQYENKSCTPCYKAASTKCIRSVNITPETSLSNIIFVDDMSIKSRIVYERNEDISALNDIILQKDKEIIHLKNRLILCEQYENESYTPCYKSESTKCILSVDSNYKSETSLSNINFVENISMNTSSKKSRITYEKNESMLLLSPIMEEPFHLSPSELFTLDSDHDSSWKSYISDLEVAIENTPCIDGEDDKCPALPK